MKKILLVALVISLSFLVVGCKKKTTTTQTDVSMIPKTQVIDGKLDQKLIDQLFSNGYTIMEFHYFEGCCKDVISVIDVLPSELQNQAVVQKIKDAQPGQPPWIFAESRFGNATYNVSGINDILPPLCKVLFKPPIDCGLIS